MDVFKMKQVLLAMAMASIVSPVALAQATQIDQGVNANTDFYSRDKYVAVLDRPQPEFDQEPIRLGAFLVEPSLTAAVGTDSNVFASENNKQSDVIGQIGASVRARTDWNNHEVGLAVSGRQNEYFDLGNESNFEFRSRLNGRLDVTRELSLTGVAYFDDRTEARTEISNSITNQAPIEFNRAGGIAGVNYVNDRIKVSVAADVSDWNYEDGTNEDGLEADQDFRDHTRLVGTARASYAVSPNVAVYGQGEIEDRSYDNPTTFGGATFERDSQGYSVLAGVDFELNSLIRGDIGVGYFQEDREDAALEDIDGLSVEGNVSWFPSELTTVSLRAARSTQDQGFVQAPSAVVSSFGARIDHELLRNVVLSAYGSFENANFDTIDREDDTLDLAAEGTWKLNKRVHLNVFVRNFDRDASGVSTLGAQSFNKFLSGIGLRLFP